MTEILLVRHAVSMANVGDIAKFGNEASPLTPRGFKDARNLNGVFRDEFGIVPEKYDQSVLASKFLRPQQTAESAGFTQIDFSSMVNESQIGRENMTGKQAIAKHASERWAPDETKERVSRVIDLLRKGDLGYRIIFTHGVFIATWLMQLEDEAKATGTDFSHVFNEERGFIPRTATITKTLI